MRLLIIAFLIVHPLALQTAAPLGAQASLPADFRQESTDRSKQAGTPALPGNFQRPWDDPNTALVIDPFHANPIDWDKLKTEPRVVAIIHKATIGVSKLDPAYFTRKKEAKKRGYLWGSYHWGVSGNPEKQADYYLDTVKPGDDELIALDLEDAASKKLMNAEESLRFIKRVKERTGRYPVLYTNHKSAKLLSAKFKGTEFAEAPLWYARFKSDVTDFPTGIWRSYTLWQFSSEKFSQMALPGLKPDMDINVYNGTVDDLRSNWPLTRSSLPAASPLKPSAQPAAPPEDALLDALVWGADMKIDPKAYAPALRIEVEQHLRRARAYRSKRAEPSKPESKMVYCAQINYERRLAAVSTDPRAAALAAAYEKRLRPCYEWEGYHDCPEREALFADEYQAAHPRGPFSDYLPLLAAHRWLCSAEAYDYEGQPAEAERCRRMYEQRLSTARVSRVLLICAAAERLAARGKCFASR